MRGTRGFPREWVLQAQIDGQKLLEQILTGTQLKGVRPLRIIPASHSYLREGVDRITRLAKRWRSDLVVTSTHSHKGLKHFVLGSFAETLLLYSDVPLLFINPNLKGASRPKHILFPTDFSEASKEAFQEVLKLAKSINGNVSLFHKIDFTLPPIIALNTRAYPLYKKAFVAEIGSKKNTATDWAKIAAAKGIRTKIIIDSKREGSLAEVILAQSKRNPGIIAMAAKSGPVMSALLGSTIRKVVRESSIPVWVLHPKDGANSQKQPLYVLTTEDVEGDLRRLPHCLDAS